MSVYSLAILCDIHVCEYEACLRYNKCPYRTSKHLRCPIYPFMPIVKGTTLSCGTGTIPPVLLLVSRTTKASRWSRHMSHRIRQSPPTNPSPTTPSLPMTQINQPATHQSGRPIHSVQQVWTALHKCCDIEITEEEINNGFTVVRCLRRGCETVWVSLISLLFTITLILHIGFIEFVKV